MKQFEQSIFVNQRNELCYVNLISYTGDPCSVEAFSVIVPGEDIFQRESFQLSGRSGSCSSLVESQHQHDNDDAQHNCQRHHRY